MRVRSFVTSRLLPEQENTHARISSLEQRFS
jgi:hypothetical protein